MKAKNILLFVGFILMISCTKQKQHIIYLGADLSYVNEMEDCGGLFRLNGELVDPFELFQSQGAYLIRVRLWHSPEWSGYSDYTDVKKTIRRAKENNMEVLLDFHYSDTWADPQKQIIPKAWGHIVDVNLLADSLYNYTLKTLEDLHSVGLTPEFVQIGNETNIEILQPKDSMVVDTINWQRNIFLLNRGLEAVDDFNGETGSQVQKMIHIAQPENALWWFGEATKNGLADFEWIGLSYYPKWSEYKFEGIPKALDSLRTKFGKRVMIVETAYPHTMQNTDPAGNILGEEALIPGYPATPEGQFKYLTDLTLLTIKGGGQGVIYWEPAWISTKCSTPWGQGSHWDNATFFDAANGNEALPAFGFFNQNQ
nr:glycosyl hydrolase 53 family protein [Bacteroidota bacterium]